MNDLRVTRYELIPLRVTFIERVTSYELFITRVASYFLHTYYELLFFVLVTNYLLHASYELLFIARVTSYCLLEELWVTVYCTSCELLFAYELRVNFYMRGASYFLTISYNKDDKAVYDNKVMMNNYSLRSVFD